jgi:hydrogenase expression/formation protein HypC
MCLAVPGKIVSVEEAGLGFRTGRVNFGGIVKSVNLSYVPEANVGDYVVVHVGFALSVVDEDEAHKVFDYLEQMGELEELKVEATA